MKRLVICLFFFLLIAPSLSLAAAGDDTAQQIESFMNEALEKYHIPGASLEVVHNGQTIFQDSWGQ
ncbi:hypothetical protein [Lysinibacillus fusiformis]|uniref:hypothetical protein n=1 Tax=Lysinibacillus fusiformis TaxID=28031 RepID=UPI002E213D75|nr:hypothetical protein [Lysinibacillus fusiformis]